MNAIEQCIDDLISTCCLIGEERYINFNIMAIDLRRKLIEFENDFRSLFIREYNFNEVDWDGASEWINFDSNWPREFSSILLVIKPEFVETSYQLSEERLRIERKIGLILEDFIRR